MKADNDQWISAPVAAELIRARLNVPPGKAQKILSDAYASGEVRKSTSVGGTSPDDPNYARHEISWSDLEYWLDEQYPAALKSKKILGLEPLKKWLRDNIKQPLPQPDWFTAALKAHPEHHIPRARWREAWSSVSDTQKLPRGRPGR